MRPDHRPDLRPDLRPDKHVRRDVGPDPLPGLPPARVTQGPEGHLDVANAPPQLGGCLGLRPVAEDFPLGYLAVPFSGLGVPRTLRQERTEASRTRGHVGCGEPRQRRIGRTRRPRCPGPSASMNDASRPHRERTLRLWVDYLGACNGGKTRYTQTRFSHGLGAPTPRPHFKPTPRGSGAFGLYGRVSIPGRLHVSVPGLPVRQPQNHHGLIVAGAWCFPHDDPRCARALACRHDAA